MRLLLITQDYPPAQGGIQTFIDRLAVYLAPHVASLTVVAPGGALAARSDRDRPVTVERIPCPSSALLAPLVVRLGALLARHRPTHVLWAQWMPAAALLLRKRGGERHGVFAHGRELLVNPLGAVGRHLCRGVVGRVDALLPNSAATAALIPATAGPGRVHVVHPGVDLNRFRPASSEAAQDLRVRLGIGFHEPVVTTLCRLVPRKGVDTLLAAVALLRRQRPDLRVVIAGTGPDLARLRSVSEALGLGRAAVFAGRIDDADLPALYALGPFALLSRRTPRDVEGFGLVLVEAQACGAPVLAARSGGMPDAVGDGAGLVVAPDDPQAAARALDALLSEPPSPQVGLAFAASLSWESRVERILDILAAT